MALETLFTAIHRGREATDTITVSLIDPAMSPENIGLVQIDGALAVNWSRRDSGYGNLVLPSYVDLVFRDRSGQVREIFRTFTENELHVSIVGTDGFQWFGKPRLQNRQTPVGTRIFGDTVEIQAHDGLGTIRDVATPWSTAPLTVTSVRYIAGAAMFAAMSEGMLIRMYNDGRPQTATTDALRHTYYADERIPNGLGEFGSHLEQLEAVCDDFGLRAFQGSDGGWYLWHRGTIGGAVTDGRLLLPISLPGGIDGPTWTSFVFPFAAAEVPIAFADLRGEAADYWDELPKSTSVQYNGTTFTTGEDGPTIVLDAIPVGVVVLTGVIFVPETDILSNLYGMSYGSDDEYRARDRFNQQDENLPNLIGAIRKTVGPQERLLYDEDGDGVAEVFIANGLQVNRTTGITAGAWSQLPKGLATDDLGS